MISNIIYLSDRRKHLEIDGIEYDFSDAANCYAVAEKMDSMQQLIRNPIVSKDEKRRITYALHQLLVHCLNDKDLKPWTELLETARDDNSLGFDTLAVICFIRVMKKAFEDRPDTALNRQLLDTYLETALETVERKRKST